MLGDLTTSIAKKIEQYFDSAKQQKTTKVTTAKNVSEYHWSFFNAPSARMPEYDVHNIQGTSNASH